MIYNTKIKDQYIQALDYMEIHKGKRIEILVKREGRSINQNSYIHLLFGWVGVKLGYTLHEVKDIFKTKFLTYEKNGYKFQRPTSDLNTKEMTDLIEQIRNYASQEMDLYLPAPNEQEYLDTIKNEIETNKKYL